MSVEVRPSDEVSDIISAFGAQLGDASKPIAILVRFKASTETAQVIVDAFNASRRLTLSEPGCRAFEINRTPGDPKGFVVFESWRSLKDLEQHLRLPHIVALRDTMNRTIEGLPEFTVLAPQAA